jgi:hypothetical protein
MKVRRKGSNTLPLKSGRDLKPMGKGSYTLHVENEKLIKIN